MKYRILILLTFYSTILFGQNQAKVDSLLQVIEKDISDKERVDVNNLLAREYFNTDSSKVAEYTSRAIALAKKIDYQPGIADAWYYLGWVTMIKRDLPKARKLFNRSLEIAQQANYQKGLGRVYNGIGSIYFFQSNYPKVLDYYQRSLKIFEQIGYKKGIVACSNNLGRIYFFQGNYPQAMDSYQRSLKINEQIGDKSGIASCYNNIADIYSAQGNNLKALDYYQRSLKINEQIGDKNGLASNYRNLGLIYRTQGNTPKALDYLQRELKIRKQIGDKSGMAACYLNIGNIYEDQGNYSQALDYYQRSLKFHEQIGEKRAIAVNYINMGLIYRKQGNYPKALDYYQRSLQIFEQIGDKSGTAQSYMKLGYLARKQEQLDEAQRYFQKALALREAIGEKSTVPAPWVSLGMIYYDKKNYPKAQQHLEKGVLLAQNTGQPKDMKDGAEYLAKTYKAMGQFDKAYENLALFKEMSDSLFNEEQTKKITSLELNYKFEQERDSIQIANQNQQALLEKDIENRRITQQATYGGLALSLALVGVLVFFFRAQKRNNTKLNAANEEVKMTNEELNTANEEIQAINETLKVTLDTVEGQKDKIMSSINYAQRIQQAILPSTAMVNKLIPSHFILFKPRDMVSGDFYYVQREHDKTILAAIDCTGHGVPGAFMSMVGNDLLNTIIKDKQITQADKILTELHEGVRSALQQEETQNRDGMDMALVVMDEENKTLEFAGAKNPIVYIQNNELKLIKGDKVPIGGEQREAVRTFTTHQIDISQPTTFYLFSDGYQDQFGGPEGRKFMIRRFRNLLLEIHQKPMKEQREVLDQTIQDWMREGKEEQVDDILVVGVRV